MKFFILNGPTASGKSAIMEYIMIQNSDYLEPVVSFTTRPRRTGERHGRDYYFISSDEYLELKKDGRVVEETRYLEWRYGVSIGELDRVESTTKNGLSIMNLHGIRQMKRSIGYQKVVSVFIYRDLVEIEKSISEMEISPAEAARRLEMAKKELRGISSCDHVVYNTGVLSESCQQLKDIIRKEINSRPMERQIMVGQKYRHFSGECCEIVAELAEHTETVSPMVVYRSLKTGLLYTRPYEIFFSKKEWPPGSNIIINRFELETK